MNKHVSHRLFYGSTYWFLCSLFLLSYNPVSSAQVIINEIISSTDNEDELGTPLEWIELYNKGNDPVDLIGYSLSDDPLAPKKWMFGSAIIPAKGFFLVWATGYGLLDPGSFHTNFRLDKDGEILALYKPDGTEADGIHYPVQRRDVSYGRQPDGEKNWFYFLHPTPGTSNRQPGRVGFLNEPEFSTQGGIFQQPFNLKLSSNIPGAEIRYTLDGSPPTESSPLYESSISIQDTLVVRARVFQEDYLPSSISTHTYIRREQMVLPILSMVGDPADLFGRSKGIIANPEGHGRSWERPVSIEFIKMNGQRAFQEDAGARIHGGASRTRSPKKSFRLYFRSEYGASRLNYPLIPNNSVDRYNQLVIRGGFNDTWGYDNSSQRPTAIYVSDQVARDLHLDMGQLASNGLFVELYINGENWGIYNPSERIEDDFLEQHTGIKEWTVVADGSEIKSGDPTLFQDLTRWIQTSRFSGPDGLEKFDAAIDRENFTSFIIMNVWIQNYDWPRHNWLCARENEAGGKWKFFLWDVEYSFGSGAKGYRVNVDVYDNALNGNLIGPLFSKIIRNEEYKTYYWRQVKHYLATVLSEEHVMKRLEARLQEIEDAIPWEAERWGERKGSDPQKTPKDWEKAAQWARDFVLVRNPIFLEHTRRAIGPEPVSILDWQMY